LTSSNEPLSPEVAHPDKKETDWAWVIIILFLMLGIFVIIVAAAFFILPLLIKKYGFEPFIYGFAGWGIGMGLIKASTDFLFFVDKKINRR